MKKKFSIAMACLMVLAGGCRILNAPASYTLLEASRPEGVEKLCWPYPLTQGNAAVPPYARAYCDRLQATLGETGEKNVLKNLQEAKSLLDDELLKAAAQEERAALERLCIIHDHSLLAVLSHKALSQDIRTPQEMEEALCFPRMLNAIRKANMEAFSGWLPLVNLWEVYHDDWAGAAWSNLFEKQRPLLRLPDTWSARVDNDNKAVTEKWENDGLEAWRSKSPIPIRMDRPWQPQVPGATGPVWLLQEVKLPPQRPKGKLLVNFRAFPGAFRLFVNHKQVCLKKDIGKITFSEPLPIEGDASCILVLVFDSGFPQDICQWPVWLGVQQD